jgi:hypothetical protein
LVIEILLEQKLVVGVGDGAEEAPVAMEITVIKAWNEQHEIALWTVPPVIELSFQPHYGV